MVAVFLKPMLSTCVYRITRRRFTPTMILVSYPCLIISTSSRLLKFVDRPPISSFVKHQYRLVDVLLVSSLFTFDDRRPIIKRKKRKRTAEPSFNRYRCRSRLYHIIFGRSFSYMFKD